MDIEHFKNELENKYKAELEQNKIQIMELNNSISEKEKTINQLEIQLKEKSQIADAKNSINIDESMEQIKKPAKPNIENEKQSNLYKPQKSNAKTDLVNENASSLFENRSDDLTRGQLEKLSLTALKKKQKN